MELKLKVGHTFTIKGTEVIMEVTSIDDQRFYGHYLNSEGGKTGNAILEKNLLNYDWFVEKILILN